MAAWRQAGDHEARDERAAWHFATVLRMIHSMILDDETDWRASVRCAAVVAALSLAIAPAVVAVGDDALVVAAADGRTNFFAGRETAFATVIRGGAAVEGNLLWVLAAGNRVLADGAVAVRHAGPDATKAVVSVTVPAGREGVAADTTLTTVLVDAAGRRLGRAQRKVRIFPEDPFVDRRRWLESLRIVLVDPAGETEKLLAAAGVPLLLARPDADLAALQPRLILIGEGMAWADHPRLSRDLVSLCAQGMNVLCLGPASGTFPLPGTDDANGAGDAASLTLRRADVVTGFDERLDWRDWSAASATVVSRLAIVADREAVVARVGEDTVGWPWLEARFSARERESDRTMGTFVVCGLGIVRHWEETPAARYLLAALLERLATPPVDVVESPPRHAPQEQSQ